jgi:hypothetical protein
MDHDGLPIVWVRQDGVTQINSPPVNTAAKRSGGGFANEEALGDDPQSRFNRGGQRIEQSRGLN